MNHSERQSAGAGPELINRVSQESLHLLEIVHSITKGGKEFRITQSHLSRIHYEAMNLEALLENHKVAGNKRWRPFFLLIQAIKSFAAFGHIIHITNSYLDRHPAIEGLLQAFSNDTKKLLGIHKELLQRISGKLLRTAMGLPLTCTFSNILPEDFKDDVILEQFEQDYHDTEHIDTEAYAINLATAFLNLSGEYQNMRPPLMNDSEKVLHFLEETVSEEVMRIFELKAFNLKTLYNKHINRTLQEARDTELSHLNDYISLVFSLIELCLILIRYGSHRSFDSQKNIETRLHTEETIILEEDYRWILVSYVLFYINAFFQKGADLCRSILQRYVEVGEIEVPIPPYGGFHVRPSNLIAKIVAHYGSPVSMQIEEERFDAAVPLELFLANETVNRRKKNFIAEEISGLSKTYQGDMEHPRQECLKLLAFMEQKGSLSLLAPLSEEMLDHKEKMQPFEEYVMKNAARLMMEGKLDVRIPCSVLFRGDKRTLKDIRILAESGYGEDSHGNNIPLPKLLSYLHREWL